MIYADFKSLAGPAVTINLIRCNLEFDRFDQFCKLFNRFTVCRLFPAASYQFNFNGMWDESTVKAYTISEPKFCAHQQYKFVVTQPKT